MLCQLFFGEKKLKELIFNYELIKLFQAVICGFQLFKSSALLRIQGRHSVILFVLESFHRIKTVTIEFT